MNLKKFKRYPLTFGVTPIEHLPRLSKELEGNLEIYAKRDDCNSGLAFGGNKLRKLEYIVPDAIESGADTLVSIGGVQSNHTRMVAATAAKIGMKCRLVQEKWVPHFDGVYDRDPEFYSDAVRYKHLTYQEVLSREIAVMDSTAIALCKDNNIPIIVFNLFEPGNISKAVAGESVGSRIANSN